jgi:RNA polymerase sigma-70 factor, ECF subfamily
MLERLNTPALDRLEHRRGGTGRATSNELDGQEQMTVGNANAGEHDKAQRFRDAALPHLDDVYTLARYLMRNTADAEDAVQECYLRALRHFDGYHGPAMKPWLLTILRNVCNAEFARRGRQAVPSELLADDEKADVEPIWQEAPPSPEVALGREQDSSAIRQLVAALPQPFRDTIVLREINDLSYQEIAQVAGVPVGTVMSRLARARSMLRSAWNAAEGAAP